MNAGGSGGDGYIRTIIYKDEGTSSGHSFNGATCQIQKISATEILLAQLDHIYAVHRRYTNSLN